jgi:hypothetical protein
VKRHDEHQPGKNTWFDFILVALTGIALGVYVILLITTAP